MNKIELPNSTDNKPPEQSVDQFTQIQRNYTHRHKWVKARIIEHFTDKVWCYVSYFTQIAIDSEKTTCKKTFKEVVPKKYYQFTKVFFEEESHWLPQ